jgi:hypothetical protein
MKKLILILLFLSQFPVHATAGLELHFDLSNLSRQLNSHERENLERFKTQVIDVLPNSLKASLNRRVTIQFVNINQDQIRRIPAINCNGEVSNQRVLGRINFRAPRFLTNLRRIYQIELDSSVMGTILTAENETYPCGHGSTYKQAKATLVHELVHLYDWSGRRLGQELEYEHYCEQYSEDELETRHYCRSFLQSGRTVSKSPYYLNIAGWVMKGILLTRRVNYNHAFARSPDPYEFTNSEEHFAVNMEFYLLDPDYACRRPSMAQYFDRVFGLNIYGERTCQSAKTVSIQNRFSTESLPISYQDIDPARVYQVHYLFAGRGPQMMSRWGHSMFRLVMCREGQAFGPDCLKDTRNDIVLSYRANIDSNTIDYTDGLTGEYDSQVFMQTMAEILQEYTIGEFRDVISLPLKMNRDQITTFVNKTLENYWAYRGQYYFVTNNCATESMNLLKTAYYDDIRFQTQKVLHPLGMYRKLSRAGLLDPSIIESDPAEAKRMTYFFPGYDERIERSFQSLKESVPHMPYENFRDYALESDSQERKAYLEYYMSRQVGSTSLRMAVAHSLRLENQILDGFEKRFATTLANALYNENSALRNSETLKQIIETLQEQLRSLVAENFVVGGYGIPLIQELVIPELQSLSPQAYGEIAAQLKEQIFLLFPGQADEMENILRNRFWIVEQLRR